jgi:alkaline phosphatase
MIEGGAVDFASHYNNLDQCIGEMIGFEEAVRVVVDWVDSPGNAATWENTLLIVTGDHECGCLTAGVRVFPDVPFPEVSARTLALERAVPSTGRRASWEDLNANNEIDVGEPVYWAWNTGSHSNSLIPAFVRGVGATRFDSRIVGTDPVRGAYIDDTAVFQVMRDVLLAPR